MKILHILSWPGINNIGGTEIFLKKMIDIQFNEGIECFVLVPGIGKKTIEEKYTLYEEQFYQIHGDFEFVNGIKAPDKFKEFKKYISDLQPDKVVFHSFWIKSIYYLRFLINSNIKVTIIPHLANLTCLRGDFLYEGRELCDGRVSINKCYSCQIKQHLKSELLINSLLKVSPSNYNAFFSINNKITRIFSKKWSIINFRKILLELQNPKIEILTLSQWFDDVLKLNEFKNTQVYSVNSQSNLQKVSIPLPKSKLKLLYVGRLVHSKGIHMIMNVLKKFDTDKVQLNVIGSIDSSFKMNEISNLPNLSYLGIKSQLQIALEMRSSDLLIIPSLSIEMRPLVLLEAIENNLYPIGSDIGGIKDIIDQFGGDLFENGNEESLFVAINNYLK